jgi:AcrR family transcriptional regulator
MAKVGRRPGEGTTRGAILDAAQETFLERGYTATTIRAVARRAEVDPALIYHYFGDKTGLFVAAMHLPVDPRRVQVDSGRGGFSGTKLVERFLAQWESESQPPGQSFVALAQAVCSSPEIARSLREFLAERIRPPFPTEVEPQEADRRRALISSQLVGLAWTRYILQIDPIASAPRAEVAEMVGPTIDRYIAGDPGPSGPGAPPGSDPPAAVTLATDSVTPSPSPCSS